MADNKYATLARKSDRDMARLAFGMLQVTTAYRQRIAKYGAGFIKADTMLQQVG